MLAKENVPLLSIVQYHQTSLTCLTTSHISTRVQSPSPNDEAQRVSVEAEGVALGGVEGAPAQTLPETREAPLVQDPQECCKTIHRFHNRLYNHGEGPY